MFAKWLAHEYELWDRRFAILNATRIAYRQIVIPSCTRCNTTHLSALEDRVSNAHDRGFDGFLELSDSDLFLWLAKLYFGATYKQLFLSANRANPCSGPIVNNEYLERYELHRSLLQGIRGKTLWDEIPASIFRFRTKPHATPATSFDYRDSVLFPFVAIRMGEVGIIAFLQDWGLISQAADEHQFLREAVLAADVIDLHPAQFAEVAARFHTAGRALTNAPTVVSIEDGFGTKAVIPMRPPNPHLANVDLDLYAEDLAFYLHLDDIDLVYENGEVITLLFGADGEPLDAPVGAYFYGASGKSLPIPW